MKGVVTHHPDDLSLRIGKFRADTRRYFPPERTGLTTDDVVARLVDALKLSRGDLIQTDGRHEACVVVEYVIYLLKYTLWLDRHIIEIRASQHRASTLLALADPLAAVSHLASLFASPCRFHEIFERVPRIRNDTQVRAENPPDLGRFDVDMNESTTLRVYVDTACVTIGPAVADPKHEIAAKEGGVAVAVLGLQPYLAGL